MSRSRLDLSDGRVLVFGEDRPFATLFCQLWERGQFERFDGAPAKAAGYHPTERDPRERVEYGEYPLDREGLERTLLDWGVSGSDLLNVLRQLP